MRCRLEGAARFAAVGGGWQARFRTGGHSAEYLSTKKLQRRHRRLSHGAVGFLEWLTVRTNAAAPLDVDTVRNDALGIAHAIRGLPPCHGQLACHLDVEGMVPTVFLTSAMAGATLLSANESSTPLVDASSFGYRGPSWESPVGGVDAEPWREHLNGVGRHYETQQQQKQKKRCQVEASTYAGELMELLVVDAMQRSHVHRWYNSVAPRGGNARHLVYNFLQEVAIAEHAKWLALMVDRPVRCVVDFGGGNGILAVAASHKLQCDSVCVDKFTPGFMAEASPAAAGFPYHRRVAKTIERVDWAADIGHRPCDCIGISKHLCGAGIDAVLRMCESENAWPAAFALSSCCHHKCRHHEYIHQGYLRALGIDGQQQLDDVARKAGWLASEHPPWMQAIGGAVESLLDFGRVLWLRERGYVAFTVSCMSPFLSPRNKMVVAWKRGGLLGP